MEPANLGDGDDLPSGGRLDMARRWCIAVERLMWVRGMVIVKKRNENPAQMSFVRVQDDDVVKTLTT